MIEGGDDWTIRDPGIKPGYGCAIRRRMITNIPDGIGPDGNRAWRHNMRGPGQPGGRNFKLVGGCTLHYGGQCWIPQEEDFHFYREASGVDWDLAKFGDAIQEIRDIYHVQYASGDLVGEGNARLGRCRQSAGIRDVSGILRFAELL